MMPKNRLHKIVYVLLTMGFLHLSIAALQADENLSRHLVRIVPKGWELMQPVKRFGPKNLWEQIDGRAEFFLSYGMVQMTFAVYAQPSDAETFIDVSIYHMENPISAFGVFAAERREKLDPLRLGRKGYQSGGSLFIWKGSYYVRMIASSDNPELRKINLDLAEKLTDIIHDSGEPVWGLDIMPEADRVPGSEQYFRQDAMGLDFMKNMVTAQYRKKGVLITLFVLKAGHPEAANDVLSRYAAYAGQLGEGFEEVVRHGVKFILCDMGGSYDALFQMDQMIAGATGIEDQNLAMDSAVELRRHLNRK